MKRLTSTLTVVITLMWLVAPAQAQMMGRKGMRGGMMGKTRPEKEKSVEHTMGSEGSEAGSYGEGPFDLEAMKERLKLTDDQIAKFKKLRSDYTKEMIKDRAAVRIAELDLFELLDAKNLDMDAAEKKVKELGEIQSGLWLYRIRTLKATSQFLTQDQFEQFRKMGFRFMRRMMGRHGGGMMGGGMGGMMGGGMGGMMGGGMHEE